MIVIRKFYRLILFALLLFSGALLTMLFLHRSVPPRGIVSHLMTTWYGLAAKIFAVKIRTYGKPLSEKTLFVSNHISWLDIIVIGSLTPVHFLSKHEIKAIPFFGWIATRAGTLYIHRGNKESASDAMVEITDALNKNQNSVVFAEGKTTNGNVKKFHGRMLQSAIDAHAKIQPIAIFYPKINTATGQTEINAAALFMGNTSAAESMNLILQQASITVEIHFLQPIEAKNRTRNELAQHAYDEVIEAIASIKKSHVAIKR